MHATSAPLSREPVSAASDRRRLRLGRLDAAYDGEGADAPLLQWVSKRNCSASPRQVLVCYGSMCSISALLAVAFWTVGAVWVAPFAGLELLVVGGALWVYARHATDHERIVLRPGRLSVEQVAAGGSTHTEFNAAWVRVALEPAGRRLLQLSGEGRQVGVGRFLRAEQRAVLADELRWALQQRPWGSSATATGERNGQSLIED